MRRDVKASFWLGEQRNQPEARLRADRLYEFVLRFFKVRFQ